MVFKLRLMSVSIYNEQMESCDHIEILRSIIATHDSKLCSFTKLRKELFTASCVIMQKDTCPFFVIVWISEGCGKYMTNFEEHDMEKDTIFFLSSENLHMLPNLRDRDGFVLAFSETILFSCEATLQHHILSNLFNKKNISACCKVTQSAKKRLVNIINMIEQESTFNEEVRFCEAYFASLLSLFIIIAEQECHWDRYDYTEQNTWSYEIYTTFNEAVEREFTRKHLVKEYAEELHISLSMLNSYIKKNAQMPPSTIINKRIIFEAKRMLLYTPKRIKEIAYLLGFEDPSNFVKFFKRQTGVLPGSFRKDK